MNLQENERLCKIVFIWWSPISNEPIYLDCGWSDPIEQGTDPAFLELGESDIDPAREIAKEGHDDYTPQDGGQRCFRHCLAISSVEYKLDLDLL